MNPAYRIVIAQAVLGCLCTGCFFITGAAAGWSALMALCCVLIPTSYFAWLQGRSLAAMRIVLHGVQKMVLTAVLMAVCIIAVGIEPLAFFLTIVVLQLSYWLELRA
ncbi:MAG: hypothetical protein AAF529_03390 [Pseudomonadota bacterium]